MIKLDISSRSTHLCRQAIDSELALWKSIYSMNKKLGNIDRPISSVSIIFYDFMQNKCMDLSLPWNGIFFWNGQPEGLLDD